MDFGFVFMGSIGVADEVRHAEERGYSHAWLYDTQMVGSEVYAALTTCALKTSKIKLGPGVTNPKSRIAPLTACGMATINQLAPGRAVLGIGTGNTTRRTMGMPAARLSDLKEHIQICRGLFDGELTDYREGDRERKIKFLNPDMGYVNIRDRIPIYVATSGPRSAQLAGEVGDGVILFGAVHPSLIRFLLDNVRQGAERAGRRFEDLYVLSMTAFYLTEPDVPLESEEVLQAVGPMVSSAANIFALSARGDPDVLPAELRDTVMAFKDAYRDPEAPIETRHLKLYSGYLQVLKEEHKPLINETAVRATTLTGSAEQVAESIEKMRKAGVHQVAVQPILDTSTTIDQFAKYVMPSFG